MNVKLLDLHKFLVTQYIFRSKFNFKLI